MSFYIYKYIDNLTNKILYIGQTNDLKRRIREHNSEEKFKKLSNYSIYYFNCTTKTETNSYEYFLIKKHNPPLNIIFNNDILNNSFFDLNEPEWQKYNEEEKNEKNENNKINKNKKILLQPFLNYSILEKKEEEKEEEKNYLIKNLKEDCFFNNLNLLEQRQLIYIFCKNKVNQENDIFYTANEFCKFSNVIGNPAEYYKLLRQSPFFIEKERNIYSLSNNGKISFNSLIYKLPLEQINFLMFTKSKYSIPILELILNTEPKNKIIMKETLLKEGISNYKEFRDFKRRCLEPALEELNILGFKYNYEKINSGRTCTGIKFNKILT